MVSALQFGWVDKRLPDIFHPDKPFSGISIILFGDFLQLQPVFGAPVYQRNTPQDDPIQGLLAFDLWSLFKPYKLTEIMRQRDDLAFAVALNHLAIGELTEDDKALFRSRKDFTAFALSDQVGNDRETQPLILCGTNKEVRNYNRLIFDALGDSDDQDSVAYDIVIGARSQADRNNIQAKTGPDANPRDVKGVIQILRLKVGEKYIISRNVKVTDGLVNGAGCILKRIETGRSEDGSRKPLKVWVEFLKETCGAKMRTN